MSENVKRLKCVVIGDGNVKKNELLVKYACPTIENYGFSKFDNFDANVVYMGNHISLGLWNTSHKDEDDMIRPISYSDADVFLFVFSLVKPRSLESIVNRWYPEILSSGKKAPVIMVGTEKNERDDKNTEKENKVSLEDAMNVVGEIGAKGYLEVSIEGKDVWKLKFLFNACIHCCLFDVQIKKGDILTESSMVTFSSFKGTLLESICNVIEFEQVEKVFLCYCSLYEKDAKKFQKIKNKFVKPVLKFNDNIAKFSKEGEKLDLKKRKKLLNLMKSILKFENKFKGNKISLVLLQNCYRLFDLPVYNKLNSVEFYRKFVDEEKGKKH